MKRNNITKIFLGLLALTSCSTVQNNQNNQSNQQNERPRIIVNKEEDHTLPNYTLIGEESYGERNFKYSGSYIYKGEQPDSDYIDTETIVKRVNIVPKKVTLYKAPENHNFYNVEQIKEFDKLISKEQLDTITSTSKTYNFDNDDYTISVRKFGTFVSGKYVFYYKAEIGYKNENQLELTLESLDTHENKKVLLSPIVKVVDPKEKATEYLKTNNRYQDLKNGFDNKRLSFEILTADREAGLSPYELKGEDDYSLFKYQDFDDLKGEHNVLVRVRAYKGFASNRDSYIENQKIVFGDKLSDYKGNYDSLFTNLEKNSLKFSKDGTEILGGFDEYKINRLIEENGKKLEFRTTILDEDKSNPTVGKHRVLREILENGKVIAKKEDTTFVSFNSPTVLVVDQSFFDIDDEVEKRTYRQTPYYVDPKFDFIGEAKEYAEKFGFDEETKDFIINRAKLERTHGATVIGAMIDELSYGGELFWKANSLASIAYAQLNKYSVESTSKNYLENIKVLLELIKNETPDSIKINNIINEIKGKINSVYIPLIKREKSIEIEKNGETVTKDASKFSQRRDISDYFYNYLMDKMNEIQLITEKEKLPLTDISFQTVSIGKKGSNIDVSKSAKYIPKILDENKNIKIVNMSYGNDASYEDYINIDKMTLAEKQKAVEAYNTRPAYRFIILAWLKNIKNEFDDLIRQNYQDSFNSLDFYDYFEKKKQITVADFEMLLNFKKNVTESRITASKEFAAANHDVLFVRSAGNTYNNAQVDLTSFTDSGKKRLIEDPNRKYNNNFASIPSLINYLGLKEAKENGKDSYKYDYSYRKNILNVVGVVPTSSIYGRSSKENYGGYSIATVGKEDLVYKNLTPGMQDRYLSLVKELNKIRNNPSDYPADYKTEIEEQIKAIEILSGSKNGEKDYYSFSRAGASKLWTVSAIGEYVYVDKVNEKDGKYDINTNSTVVPGSSFAAPRVSAVASQVQKIYPWMTAHNIKQVILTTAKDDYRIVQNPTTNKIEIQGIYGVDDNLGWGILDRNKAYKGPARFVKALTHEIGEENFIANIPYGFSEFSNDIEGGFNPTQLIMSNGYLTPAESLSLSSKTADERQKFLEEKTLEYIKSIPFEERELFLSAGLTKKGKGTLVLSGRNTYTGDTIVEEGTLVERGASKSTHIIHEGAKLKLDLKYRAREENRDREVDKAIYGDIHNNGSLYSYSDADTVVGTYYPYEKAKTYISVSGHLSIYNLNLIFANEFNIEVFRNKGDNKYLSKDTDRIKIFDANIADSDLLKVRYGTFAISKFLNLEMKQEKGKLVAYISKRTNDRNTDFTPIYQGNTLPNVPTAPENTNEATNTSASSNTENSNIPPAPPLPPGGIGESDNGGTRPPVLPPPPFPPIPPASEGVGTATNIATFEERLNDRLIEDIENGNNENVVSVSALQFMNDKDLNEINGQSLVDSLTIGYQIEDIRLSNIHKSLLKDYKENKLVISADVLTKLMPKKDSTNNLVLGMQISGTQIGINYRKNNTLFGIYLDYINGTKLNDLLKTTESNSLGVSIFAKNYFGNIELTNLLSVNTLFKTVTKDVLVESRSYQEQNQENISLISKLSYVSKISDKFSIIPSISLNNYIFIFNKYDEKDTILGLKYDTQSNYRVSTKLGIDLKYDINDKFKLLFNTELTAWLTKPILDLKVKNSKYEDITNSVKSAEFSRIFTNFGIGLNYAPTDRINLIFNYDYTDLDKSTLRFGMSFEY